MESANEIADVVAARAEPKLVETGPATPPPTLSVLGRVFGAGDKVPTGAAAGGAGDCTIDCGGGIGTTPAAAELGGGTERVPQRAETPAETPARML